MKFRNIIIHPSKIWHCIVVFMLIVLFDVILLEICNVLGHHELPKLHSECFLMFGFMVASSVIYYKMNSSTLTLSLIMGDVRIKEVVIFLTLFLLFASSTVLLNPHGHGELINDATFID